MKREDLRSKIIPTTIENTDEMQNLGNEKFNTTDLIYLDGRNEQFDIREVKDFERKNYISYITNWRICKNKSRRRFE